VERDVRWQGRCRQVLSIGHHHHVGGPVAKLPEQTLHQRHEGQVDEQHPVLGMVDDVGDLRLEQPRVDGVDYRPHAGNGEVELVMAVAVPGQRPDPVTRTDVQPFEHPGEAAGTPFGVAVGVAMARTLDRVADDLGLAVMPRGEREQRRNQQWLLLHQAQHGSLSPPSRATRAVTDSCCSDRRKPRFRVIAILHHRVRPRSAVGWRGC
jgi:hypothetical protein